MLMPRVNKEADRSLLHLPIDSVVFHVGAYIVELFVWKSTAGLFRFMELR